MKHCTKQNCGKAWDDPHGDFPLCIEYECPLRLERDEEFLRQQSHNLHLTQNATTQKGSVLVASSISGSLTALRSGCGKEIQPYNMDGAQSATTTVKLGQTTKSFRTQNQMHSEMRAIEWMLAQGYWKIYLGLIVWAETMQLVKPDEFVTTEPHCGFCTIFLIAARLPLGKPTQGNHNLASRLNYQLPVELEINPNFIARVLDSGCYCGFPKLKQLLNAFLKIEKEKWVLCISDSVFVDDYSYIPSPGGRIVVYWSALCEGYREVVYLAWKVIFEQIQLTNKGSD